ncbi:MFS transporter [Lentzea sp. CA-135723]|uniref:MFS transporter n=1 Tax=Lentzea sp. CA-135723 TaxID=3239950 RepID=UPI003D8AD8CA
MNVKVLTEGLVPRTRSGRLLTFCAGIDSLTIGLFLAVPMLYFVPMLGIEAVTVGLVLSIANVAGLLSPVPFGSLADRVGPNRVYIGLMVVRATGFVSYVFVTEVVGYLVVTTVIAAATRACLPLLQVVVGEVEDESTRARTTATLRAFNNIGLTGGFLVTALAQLTGSRLGFQAAFVLDALALLSAAGAMLLIGKVTRTAPAEEDRAPRTPFRDLRFLVLTSANAILLLHDAILFVLLPLWIVRQGLPGPVGPLLLAVNTVLTVLLQITLSRNLKGVAQAARMLRRGCAFMLLSCALFLVAEHTGWALVLAAAAVVALTIGENMHTIAAWEMSYAMAPPAARGRYLSLFSAGASTELVFGPVLITAVVLPAAALGWVILAALFAAATALMIMAFRPTTTTSEVTHV